MKILVLRFSSIGDIVLCTPVVRILAEAGHEVHFLTKKSYRQLLDSNPYVSKTKVLGEDWGILVQELKAENYDLLIDLHKNLRTLRLKCALRVKSYSFNKINIHKWLKIRFSTYRLPQLHIVDRYLKTIEPLGLKNDFKGLDYFFPAGFEFDTRGWLSERKMTGPYTAWVIGGTHKTKQFPEHRIKEIIDASTGNYVLIGGPEEKGIGDRLAHNNDHVVSSAGYCSIAESSALIRDAQLVISNDTGMMHIAAALKKKVISLWGNTIPEFGMSPYLPQNPDHHVALETEGLPCRPCSKIGFQECPKKHFNCMNGIETERLLLAKKELLKN